MKEIKLTQGKVALVDDEDFERLNQHKWCAAKTANIFYAVRTEYNIGEKQKRISMHREVLNIQDRGIHIDHIDHDGLNCQKSNLRQCTHAQNMHNRRSRRNTSSKYLGVQVRTKHYEKTNRTVTHITAGIAINGKYTHIGSYKTEEEAAKAYDEMAKTQYGEFANLNFK